MNTWPLLWVLLAASVMMALGWLWQRRTDNAGIVDVLWSAGMAMAAVYYSLAMPGAALPRLLVGLMGGVWGARLALHLARRVFSEQEDGRYRNLRARWSGNQRSFFLFFQAQAVFVVFFSVPFWIAAHNPVAHWTPWKVGAVWVSVSFIGPALMLAFLYRVTGIPYTEAQALRTRGEDYAEYQRTTSPFLPLPPKH